VGLLEFRTKHNANSMGIGQRYTLESYYYL